MRLLSHFLLASFCAVAFLRLEAQTDGQARWQVSFPGENIHRPAVGPDGVIYVTTSVGTRLDGGRTNALLYALSPSGLILWEEALQGPDASPPVVAPSGMVYLVDAGGLAAWSASGDLTWRFARTSPPGTRWTPTLTSDGGLLAGYIGGVGTTSPFMVALDPDGGALWTNNLDGAVSSSAVSQGDGLVLAVSAPAGEVALARTDGSFVWRRTAPDGATSPFVMPGAVAWTYDGGVVLPLPYQRTLLALNSDGTQRWASTAGQFQSPAIIAADGTVVVGCYDDQVLGLTPGGAVRWAARTGGAVIAAPAAAADGTVYFGCLDGRLYALAADGSPLWTFDAGSPVGEPPVLLDDGDILIATSGGVLVDIVGGAGPAASSWPQDRHDARNTGLTPAMLPALSRCTNFSAVSGSPTNGTIALQWSSAAGALSYDVLRGVTPDPGLALAIVTNLHGLTWADLTSRAGVTNYYWVRANGVRGAAVLTGPVDARQDVFLWGVALPGLTSMPVVADDGTIVVGLSTGPAAGGSGECGPGLMAFDPTGSPLWSMPLCTEVPPSRPVIGPDGTVYHCGAGTLFAVAPGGGIKWSAAFNPTWWPEVNGMAVSADGLVAVNTGESLLVYDDDGTLLLNEQPLGGFSGHPTIAVDGRVVLSGSGEVAGFTPAGQPWYRRWWGLPAAPFASLTGGSPSVMRGGDLVVCTAGGLLGFNSAGVVVSTNDPFASLGVPLYPPPDPTNLFDIAIAGDGTMRFVVGSDRTHSLAVLATLAPDGVDLILSPLGAAATGGPVLDALGNAYVAAGTEVLVFDAAGRRTKSHPLPGLVRGAPVLTSQGVLLAVGETNLFAFQAEAGFDTNAPWPMQGGGPRGASSAEPAVGIPPVPSGFALAADTVGSVVVNWPVPDRWAHYQVYRSLSPEFGTASLLGSVGSASGSFTDQNLVPGTVYYYWLVARNFAGASAPSGPVVVTVPAAAVAWSRSSLGYVGGPVVGPDGSVYVVERTTNAAGSFQLTTLSPDGGTRWVQPGYFTGPAVDPSGNLYLGGADGVWSFTGDGRLRWKVAGTGVEWVRPVVDGIHGLVYAMQAGFAGPSLGLRTDGTTNAVLGAFQAPVSLATDGSLRSVSYSSATVFAMDPAGETLWSVPGLEVATSQPLPVGLDDTTWLPLKTPTGTGAYAGVSGQGGRLADIPAGLVPQIPPLIDSDGNLVGPWGVLQTNVVPAVQMETARVTPQGGVLWQSPAFGQPLSLALTADGGVIVGGLEQAGLLDAQGRLVWRTALSRASTALAHDGRLYLMNGVSLTAIDTDLLPAQSGWTSTAGNPRQSGGPLLPRNLAAVIHGAASGGIALALAVEADDGAGAVLLESADLRHWRRSDAGWLTNSTTVLTLPGGDAARFFRLVQP